MSIVGENVKRYRVAAGLSQAELSQLSRTTQPQISAMERGAISPTIETLERVAEALGVGLVDLVAEPAPKGSAPRSGRFSREDWIRAAETVSGPLETVRLSGEEEVSFARLLRPVIAEAVREALDERERQVPQERH